MSSECVLEFRSPGDDAWYSARVAVEGEVLRVNYLGFSEEDDEVFRASSFKSRREVDVFKDRFRAVSIQVEDSNCSEVVTGDRVCASFSFHDDDVRFYDAFVDGVLTPHSQKCLFFFFFFFIIACLLNPHFIQFYSIKKINKEFAGIVLIGGAS
jgi:hypothetical protein